MTDEAIRAAHRVMNASRSRDPVRIAGDLDIEILSRTDFTAQKGAFCVVQGYPFIFLNASLGEQEMRTVCAHELGHAVLHRRIAQKGALCEFDLFHMATQIEYEANVFAAELLIDGNELKEYLESGMDVYAAAGALEVPVNLLIIRLAEMNRRGGSYRLPYLPDKGFLGE